MEIIVYSIDWETDGETVELPNEVAIPAEEIVDECDIRQIDSRIGAYDPVIADYLSDEYGWLVNGFETRILI